RVGLVVVDTGARLLGPLGGGGFAGLHTWLRAIGVLRVVRVGRIASGVGLVLVVLVVLVVPLVIAVVLVGAVVRIHLLPVSLARLGVLAVPLVIAVVLVGAVVRIHLLPVSVARGLLRLVVELGGGVLSPVSLVVSVVSIGARPAVATVTVVVHVLRLRCRPGPGPRLAVGVRLGLRDRRALGARLGVRGRWLPGRRRERPRTPAAPGELALRPLAAARETRQRQRDGGRADHTEDQQRGPRGDQRAGADRAQRPEPPPGHHGRDRHDQRHDHGAQPGG